MHLLVFGLIVKLKCVVMKYLKLNVKTFALLALLNRETDLLIFRSIRYLRTDG